MTIIRRDLGSEANIARRLFWEMCASRAPQCYAVETRESGNSHYLAKEDEDDVAKWADQMLLEWDKRWIAEETYRLRRLWRLFH